MSEPFSITRELIQIAAIAAQHEILNNPKNSSVPNPDGSPQVETEAEREQRVLETGIMHLIEQRLITVSPDAEKIINEQGVPIARQPIPEALPRPGAVKPGRGGQF